MIYFLSGICFLLLMAGFAFESENKKLKEENERVKFYKKDLEKLRKENYEYKRLCEEQQKSLLESKKLLEKYLNNNIVSEVNKDEKEDMFKNIVKGQLDDYPKMDYNDLAVNYIKYEAPDRLGNIYGHISFRNNSKYIVNNITCEVAYTDSYGFKQKSYYTYNNSILPNEDSLDMKGYGSKDMKIIKINFSFMDVDTLLKCDIEYELNTNLINWSKWY